MIVSPDDANDKWYYKLTSVTTTSADLIAGNFLDYTAVDQDTAPTAVATADKVKFLFVKNTSTADGIVISIDAGTAAFNLADGILYVGFADKDEKIIFSSNSIKPVVKIPATSKISCFGKFPNGVPTKEEVIKLIKK